MPPAFSRVALIVVIIETDFFQQKFGVQLQNSSTVDVNDPQLHMIAYLQVAIISQALIFVTRAHGFFFAERPSFALLAAFAVAQLVSSIIAAYGNWGFTDIQAISGGWIGIIWVWVRPPSLHRLRLSSIYFPSKNIIWFIPLDWIKLLMNATVIRYIRNRRVEKVKLQAVAQSAVVEQPAGAKEGMMIRRLSRTASVHESLYSNRTNFLRKTMKRMGGLGDKVTVKEEELKKVGSIQAKRAGQALVRHSSTLVERDEGVSLVGGP